MRDLRNPLRDALIERLNPARDRRVRRDGRFTPEWLERRAAPSSTGDTLTSSALVEPLSTDVPEPDDNPLAPPPDIPIYTPPTPPGGPGTPQ